MKNALFYIKYTEVDDEIIDKFNKQSKWNNISTLYNGLMNSLKNSQLKEINKWTEIVDPKFDYDFTFSLVVDGDDYVKDLISKNKEIVENTKKLLNIGIRSQFEFGNAFNIKIIDNKNDFYLSLTDKCSTKIDKKVIERIKEYIPSTIPEIIDIKSEQFDDIEYQLNYKQIHSNSVFELLAHNYVRKESDKIYIDKKTNKSYLVLLNKINRDEGEDALNNKIINRFINIIIDKIKEFISKKYIIFPLNDDDRLWVIKDVNGSLGLGIYGIYLYSTLNDSNLLDESLTKTHFFNSIKATSILYKNKLDLVMSLMSNKKYIMNKYVKSFYFINAPILDQNLYNEDEKEFMDENYQLMINRRTKCRVYIGIISHQSTIEGDVNTTFGFYHPTFDFDFLEKKVYDEDIFKNPINYISNSSGRKFSDRLPHEMYKQMIQTLFSKNIDQRDILKIHSQIRSILKSIITCNDFKCRSKKSFSYWRCFNICALDIIIDEKYNVNLLECNTFPVLQNSFSDVICEQLFKVMIDNEINEFVIFKDNNEKMIMNKNKSLYISHLISTKSLSIDQCKNLASDILNPSDKTNRDGYEIADLYEILRGIDYDKFKTIIDEIIIKVNVIDPNFGDSFVKLKANRLERKDEYKAMAKINKTMYKQISDPSTNQQ